MNYIYWLEIVKTARHAKHLSNHFILKIENKFMVFTSKPLTVVKCSLISPNENITGEYKAQWIAEKIHQVNPNIHIISEYEKGLDFCTKYSTGLQPWLDKMQIVIEKIT